MIKKLFLVVAILFLATNVYAMSETTTGPQHITSCYMIGVGPITSGDVVVLQTSSPTYWGREVTGSVAEGELIYGVVVDQRDITNADTIDGEWINVQTHGYCPIVRISHTGVTMGTSHLVTSVERFRAASANEVGGVAIAGAANQVTGTTIALEDTKGAPSGVTISGEIIACTTTIKAFINQ